MTESFLVELVKQGGFALLAGVMFLVYRHDAKVAKDDLRKVAEEYAKKQAESATAWMTFGQAQGALMERLTGAIERIEHRLDESTMCPVTSVTNEALREAMRDGHAHSDRRRIDRVVAHAVRSAIRGEGDAQS